MAWFFLLAAGLAEIVFAVSLKYNIGFTRLIPSLVTMVAGCSSFYLLTLAIKVIPLGTAYAIWTGMGAVGVAIVGILMFKEAHDWMRLVSIILVVAGVLGLKLTHNE
ncbi:MAG: multidrug efflux SMR transporter [Methylococcales bacterium]|nr:multidrug efflux SMR transporter [Methylococcales bacterium]